METVFKEKEVDIMYNLMTGEGFADKSIMGTWSVAFLCIPILFFLWAFASKYLEDYNFNRAFSLVGTFLFYLIIISIFGQPKYALLAGIVGCAIGGFLGGMFLGSGSDGGGSF